MEYTSEIKEYIKNIGNTTFTNLKILITSSNTTITNEDIHSNSVVLKSALCESDELTFGGCIASEFSFTASNYKDTLIVGEEIKVTFDIVDNENNVLVENIPVGVFYIDSATNTNDKSSKDIVSYDSLYSKSNIDVSDFYNNEVFEKITNEYGTESYQDIKLSLFLTKLLNNLGISYRTFNLTNANMMISKTLAPDNNLYGIDLLRMICEINGCFGYIDSDGYFDIKTISNEASKATIYSDSDTGLMYKEFSVEEKQLNDITCINLSDDSESVGVTVGTDTSNPYVIQGNYFLYGKSTSELEDIGDNILKKINSVHYYPFECSAYGSYWLDLGDNITISNEDTDYIETILKREIRGFEGMLCYFSADGNENRDNFATENTELKTLKGKTLKITKTVEEFSTKIEDIEKNEETLFEQTSNSIVFKVDKNGNQALVELSADPDTAETKYSIDANYVEINSNNFSVGSDGVEIKGENARLDIINSDGTYFTVDPSYENIVEIGTNSGDSTTGESKSFNGKLYVDIEGDYTCILINDEIWEVKDNIPKYKFDGTTFVEDDTYLELFSSEEVSNVNNGVAAYWNNGFYLMSGSPYSNGHYVNVETKNVTELSYSLYGINSYYDGSNVILLNDYLCYVYENTFIVIDKNNARTTRSIDEGYYFCGLYGNKYYFLSFYEGSKNIKLKLYSTTSLTNISSMTQEAIIETGINDCSDWTGSVKPYGIISESGSLVICMRSLAYISKYNEYAYFTALIGVVEYNLANNSVTSYTQYQTTTTKDEYEVLYTGSVTGNESGKYVLTVSIMPEKEKSIVKELYVNCNIPEKVEDETEKLLYVTKDGELYIKGNIEATSITLGEDAEVSGNIEAKSGTIGTFEIYENSYGYGLQSEGMNDFEGLRLNGENGAIFQYSESNSKWFHLIDTTAQWCTLGDIENPNWDVVDSRNYVTIDSDSGIKISSDSQESENSLSVWRYSGAENTSDSYQNGAAIKCVVTEIGSPKNSAFLGIIASKETSDADYTYQNFRVFGQDDYGGKLVVRADNGFDSLSSAPECTLGQTNFPWTYGFFENLKVNGTAVTSDRKAKNDIKELSEEYAVKLIYGLDAKTFKYNNAKTGKTHMGFIAQDVASLCNDLEMPVMSLYDATVKGDDNDTPYVDGTPDEQLTWYLNYTELIAPLVKTVQSQNKKIISLEKRITKLEEIIANLAN